MEYSNRLIDQKRLFFVGFGILKMPINQKRSVMNRIKKIILPIIGILCCMIYLVFPSILGMTRELYYNSIYMIGKVYVAIPLMYLFGGIILGILIFHFFKEKNEFTIRKTAVVALIVILIFIEFLVQTYFRFSYFIIKNPIVYLIYGCIAYLISWKKIK